MKGGDRAERQEGVWEVCQWVVGYALKRWRTLAGSLGAMLAQAGLEVLRPWPVVVLVDYVLGGKPFPEQWAAWFAGVPGTGTVEGWIGWCVGATVVLFLLSWSAGLATAHLNLSLGQRMVYDLAADLFAKLQKLSLRYHATRSVGDQISRITGDCTCVSVILKDALLPVLGSLVTLAAMFAIMWRMDPTLTLLALAVLPLMVVAFRMYAGPMTERSYRQQEEEGRIYGQVEQTFQALPVVQAFRREAMNVERFHRATESALAATLSTLSVQLRFKVLVGLATAAGTAGIFWIGGRHALAGDLTEGGIILFLSYLASLYAPLESVMYTASTIQGAAGSARRVREVLGAEEEVRDRPGAVTLGRVRGRIEIEGVTFGYDRERPVLRDVSVKLEPGETVALVGATGAGKTTLAGLVPRFFDPWSGEVQLDGKDARDVTLRSLRSQIALVLQEPFLFPLTIAENIAYGNPRATRGAIEAAARAAHVEEFIRGLAHGYETVVGDRGATLSGGQRQRLSIARAFLKNAPILILDEPTSALDADTEAALVETLGHFARERTTLIIAHRMSTILRADRIVVLEEGRIVEVGRHEELLRANGVYARFHRIQFGLAGG